MNFIIFKVALILVIIGFITGGPGGLFVFSGGLLTLIGQTKATQSSTV